MIKVNGVSLNNISGLALETYLLNEGYTISRVAVELNGNIVPKSLYEKTILKEGDILEVVSFVGGG
ncbi:sulfur carrier protein ThiS [uncultured Clostridium sp.]|uniref:sulfur carrier protein ThiS n=1 Tax=uncultured Clostridium sp. TaxID=59620 RepID=UPI0025E2A075|nr:sulfur carrier protein ThiS [uncultured Clostridium sp.]